MESSNESVQETLMVDRLSSLHDTLLTHILSFLPTSEIVRTCLLAKRWRSLWSSVPDLNFEVKTSVDEDFIDGVISHHPLGSDIRRFRLNFSSAQPDRGPRVSQWILYATSHNARELDIDLGSDMEFEFLSAVLSCHSLEYLKLTARRIRGPLNLSDSFCLGKLNVLNLHGIRGIESEFLGKLITICPQLTKLCLLGKFDELDICSPNLKELDIWTKKFSKIHVYCPRLEIFVFYTDRLKGRFHGDMPSLATARITMPFKKFHSAPLATDILESVRHVDDLHLYSDKMSSSGPFSEERETYFPTFYRLKTLTFDSCFHDDNMETIICLLNNLPTVNFLCINLKPRCSCANKKGSWTSRKLHVKILNHLKEVKITDIKGHQYANKWEFVKFLAVNVGAWEGVNLKII